MRIFLLLISAMGLVSCETTGDPRQGGLFGWSEGQAQGRIYERQRTLDDIERDTARQRSRSRRMESQLD